MCLLPRLSGVFALLAFLLVGCAQVTDDGTAPLTLAVSSQDVDQGPRTPLEGAKLCDTGTDRCVFTDSSGGATLRLPVGQESSYTLEKEGHGSYLVALVMAEAGFQHQLTMSTDGHLKAQFERIMSPYPMRDSGTALLEVRPALAGVTFELDDATGVAFYYDEQGRWSPDLTATTSLGLGGFAEITEGTVQLNLGGAARQCSPGIAWPGNENSIRFPIRKSYITIATAECPL